MNIDTGAFEALSARVEALAAQVAFLEQRGQAYDILIDVGRESALRKLGLPPAANVRAADAHGPPAPACRAG